MASMSVRGGIPYVLRESFDTTGREVKLPFPILYLICRNKGGVNPGRLYFTGRDYNNGTNYVEVPIAAAETPHGEWQGPVETIGASNHTSLYLQGDGGSTTLELVVFQRRG